MPKTSAHDDWLPPQALAALRELDPLWQHVERHVLRRQRCAIAAA